MQLTIQTTFEGDLFAAYDISDLHVEVTLDAAEHEAGTLRFHALLDIENRETYEDEDDIPLPDAVELFADQTHAIEGSGGLVRRFELPLVINFLDGLKNFASDSLWKNEDAYELWVRASLKTPAGELEEIATLALSNPWKHA